MKHEEFPEIGSEWVCKEISPEFYGTSLGDVVKVVSTDGDYNITFSNGDYVCHCCYNEWHKHFENEETRTKHKFKVGDEIIDSEWTFLSNVGLVGNVVGYTGRYTLVDFGNGSNWPYLEHELCHYRYATEQKETPTEDTEGATQGYDLSDHMDGDTEDSPKAFLNLPEHQKQWQDRMFDFFEEQANANLRDNVNSPSHYGQGSIECIEYIKDVLTTEEYIGYLRGNLIKYHHRHRYKGKPVEDLSKAQWYLNRLIEITKENN